MCKKILYIQYTNPAGYPALEHSSQILANKRWKVLFLGTGCFGRANDLRLRPHPNIRVHMLPFCQKKPLQKLHHLLFCAWVALWALLWRPEWVYASDTLSCPIGLILSFIPKIKIIYHEHDSPNPVQNTDKAVSNFMKFALWARKRLASRALLWVFPNQQRARIVANGIGKKKNIISVFNCPSLEEVKPSKSPYADEKIRVYYHGNIDQSYLPVTILKAIKMLPSAVDLDIIGYETVGSKGYISHLKQEARSLGIKDRVNFFEPVSRHLLLERCTRYDVGLAFIPRYSDDINNHYKIGASNRPFDYLACGLALLVSDLPDWEKTYVEPGYGLACNPDSPESIAYALEWFIGHPEDMRKMGELGRQKVLAEWNYQRQFAPVLARLNKEHVDR